jgi:methylaspartate mutase sigma subunit
MIHEIVRREGLDVVVTSVSSDSHTWNLVYLQLVLEELGHRVTNLGACTPEDLVVATCLDRRPDLLVVSSVNGHGRHDGARLIRAIRGNAELATLPVVIGGKLDTAGGADGRAVAELIDAGFTGVFQDAAALTEFRSFVGALPAGAGRELAPVGA